MKLKLSTRITLIYALIFTLVLLAINGAVFVIVRFYNTSSDNIQLINAKSKVEQILSNKGSIQASDLEKAGVLYPMVVQVIADDLNFSNMPGVTMTMAQPYDRLSYRRGQDLVNERAAVMKTEYVDTSLRKYKISVGKSVEESFYNRRVSIITTAIASFLGMLFSLAVGSYMSHESFKPINNMRESVESISPKNIHDRIEVPSSGDELTDLGNTFNSLLDQLDSAYTKQSKFVSDASHELRTPLTVIKGYVDMLKRWGKKDPEILDEAIEAIQSETKSMSSLVENLLFIAKGENRRLQLHPESVDLASLAEAVVAETRMSAGEKYISFSGESLNAIADEKMIKQMIRIFMENSMKFTGPQGQIQVSLEKDQGRAKISVWDNGDGIAPEDQARLFERFYVADKARTKDKSGSGLGLSIAKWICDVHGGTIQVASKLGEYTQFTVHLPLDGKALVANARNQENTDAKKS